MAAEIGMLAKGAVDATLAVYDGLKAAVGMGSAGGGFRLVSIAGGGQTVLAPAGAAVAEGTVEGILGGVVEGSLSGFGFHTINDFLDNLAKIDADRVFGGEGGTSTIKSSDLVFGSSTKSTQKLMNQMNGRGWTEDLIRNTVENPYTIRTSINKATGNSATVFYTQQGSYVIVDDVTKAIVQISDNINPSTWIPDLSIVDPYIPD